MNYILDTNILVAYLRKADIYHFIERTYKPFDKSNFSAISIVSHGELFTIAKRNNWGRQKIQALEEILRNIMSIPIDNSQLTRAYAEIETYSQNWDASKPLPMGVSPRNMKDNDLWIAATAHATRSTLLTTDGDFHHLDGVYFPLIELDPQADYSLYIPPPVP